MSRTYESEDPILDILRIVNSLIAIDLCNQMSNEFLLDLSIQIAILEKQDLCDYNDIPNCYIRTLKNFSKKYTKNYRNDQDQLQKIE